MRIAFVLGLIVLSAATACSSATSSFDPDEPAELVFRTDRGDVTLQVEIADTDDERRRGLMERESLGPNRGMAFVWDEPVETTFWMKNTLIPLSIAFWDATGRVIAMREMTPCEADTCPRYGAPAPFVGAAEATERWFTLNGIKVGDTVELFVPNL